MRPGPHPWATNDVYAGGPDIASDSKTETLDLHKEDGYYRSRRPAPDILNWQLNRNYIAHQICSRVQAMNYRLMQTTGAIGAAHTMGCGTHVVESGGRNRICLYWFDGAGNQLEVIGSDGGSWSVPLSNPPTAVAGAITSQDVAGDIATTRRVLCANAPPIADRVFTALNFGAGAWGLITFVAGAPGKHWQAIGCDGDTAAVGSATWIIGDSGAGGTVAPVAWSSTDGINFAVIAAFPALAIGQQVYFIGHTRHAVDALGPSDPGNPSWLVLTSARSLVSTDGVTWSDQAHGFAGGVPTRKSAAYSKTSGRWVYVENGGSLGDVQYSDDNGITWTPIVGALAGVSGAKMDIVSDGYGTFIASEGANTFWVSVDDGMSWTSGGLGTAGVSGPTSGYDETVLEVGVDESMDVSTVGRASSFFTLSYHDDAAPLLECYRSLIY